MHCNANTIHNLLHASTFLSAIIRESIFALCTVCTILTDNVRIKDAKKLDLTTAYNKSSVQVRCMRKNGSTIDIMDHHHQHHPLAFGLFLLYDANFFLGLPTSLPPLGLYSKAIFGIRDPFIFNVFSWKETNTHTHTQVQVHTGR